MVDAALEGAIRGGLEVRVEHAPEADAAPAPAAAAATLGLRLPALAGGASDSDSAGAGNSAGASAGDSAYARLQLAAAALAVRRLFATLVGAALNASRSPDPNNGNGHLRNFGHNAHLPNLACSMGSHRPHHPA